jgi:hypothetical protein
MSAMTSKMRTSILNNYCFIPEIDVINILFELYNFTQSECHQRYCLMVKNLHSID